LKVIAKLSGHIKTAFNTLGFDENEAKNPFEPFEGTR
jgi:23S rRNA pseudouridine955/2504/2580 synthase